MAYRNKSKEDLLFDIFNYALMIFLAMLFIYPFWQTLVLSFSSPSYAMSMGLKLFPDSFNIKSYQEVFSSRLIYVGYANTIIRTVAGTLITIMVTYCGAYALSKKALPFRNAIMLLILFTMFFGGGLIPSYLLMKNLNLLDSLWALILPSATSAMPIIAVLALWSAVGHWNAWFDAMIYVRDRDKMVLQLILRQIIISNSNDVVGSGNLLNVTTAETTPETVKAATIIAIIAPIIFTYPFLQKYFVKGIMVGALKG